jgi:hypothetical protein
VKRLIALVLALSLPAVASADPTTRWNVTATTASFAAGLDNEFGCVDPLHESRLLAMMHVAIHDALNAIHRRYQPYAYHGPSAAGASPEAAVAAAARDVLVALFPQLPAEIGATPGPAVAIVENAYMKALSSVPNSRAKAKGILVGQAAAAAILALRDDDGSAAPFLEFNYVAGSDPGDFQLIPGFPFAAAPSWGSVTPFVLRASSQYRPRPPYDLRSRKYAADFNEVKSLGRVDSTTRSDEQTEIALFWVEGSPQGWNRIARTVVARKRGLDLWDTARLFGLLNLASADAYIADFENKYSFKFWRPITAIRAAASDGNPRTEADPTWDSLVPTPPAPDYPSGHSGQGGAMAEVLARFFGDDVSFRTTSTTRPGIRRSFGSFSQAAAENANSRIYVGFHFRHATIEGLKLGRRIGRATFTRTLRPVRWR